MTYYEHVSSLSTLVDINRAADGLLNMSSSTADKIRSCLWTISFYHFNMNAEITVVLV